MTTNCLHILSASSDCPSKFTYPFDYTPHPLCTAAADEVKLYLASLPERKGGKMYGVLIVKQASTDSPTPLYYLAAYSGAPDFEDTEGFFVPPIYALPQDSIPHTAEESQHLQHHIFAQYHLLNARGEKRDMLDIFKEKRCQYPPSGAGECCAPKLLQYAYEHNLTPICMGEFWQGESPKGEIRYHNHWYPACQSKCKPILGWMLQGLEVEEYPLLTRMREAAKQMTIIYDDEWIVAVNKPAGMLAVPGNLDAPSVESRIREMYPDADGPLIVHRLDMDTSGIMILAKTKDTHKALQEQFYRRQIRKKYIAILDGPMPQTAKGIISLPLGRDNNDRPRQMVDHLHGKEAMTEYEVIDSTHIAFYPITGRTHQLRVHAASKEGLGAAILGDRLYGNYHQASGTAQPPPDRLFLQAQSIDFTHPFTGNKMHLEISYEF